MARDAVVGAHCDDYADGGRQREDDLATGPVAKRRKLGPPEEMPIIRGLLPGARFVGVQQSGRATYDVEVSVKPAKQRMVAPSSFVEEHNCFTSHASVHVHASKLISAAP